MKILCIIDSLGSGGAQRQLVELAKGFKERDHEVSFLIYHDINFFRSELDRACIPIILVKESNYFKRILKIRKEIINTKPNAVLSFLEGANFMTTLAGFPYRKWNLVVGERSANPNIMKSLKLQLYRWMHLFTSFVVANSKANMKIVKKVNPLLTDNKCKVIYNFSTMDYKELNENKLHKEKTIVTVPASYRKVKNLDGLIEGVNLLEENYRKKLIVNWFGNKEIEGGSIYFKNAFSKIKEYNLEEVIILKDVSNDIYSEYEKSDYIALLSHFEGFPNVICEAMMLGKPVITSRVSDLLEIIKENENGFTCDPTSPKSIKSSFQKAIDASDNMREQMGSNNLEIAHRFFNKNKIIDAYLNLLNSNNE